ncbi:peptidoglycan-binding protein [Streptomyces sp. NPDC052236]|uniref:peptidoglycan-binding protein n=1 Tax=Streptomyces sp. NPDC052236 TaxID=3365686 RepID=UPI0037D6ECB2
MSTPSGPRQPMRRPTLEPTHVLRRRRPRPLSDLLDPDDGPDYAYESVAVPASDEDTQELPPVVVDSGNESHHGDSDAERQATATVAAYGRRPTVTVMAAIAVAALVGFGIALLLTGGETDTGPRAGAGPSAGAGGGAGAASPAPAPSRAAAGEAADPDGSGTLREGATGPAVTGLQERLLRIPNVYEGGSVTGSYDATLTAAVSRFQLWYGIRGDETGVYGDDTRRDLESRTSP